MRTPEQMQCGECGHKGLVITNLKGAWGMAWRDFPYVRVSSDLQLPQCPVCKNVVLPGDRLDDVNSALQETVQSVCVDLLSEIKERNQITFRDMAKLTGVTPEYLSMLMNRKKVASFQFMQLLAAIRTHPDFISEVKSGPFFPIPPKAEAEEYQR